MAMDNPRWFWQAIYTDGSTMTFYADNKPLAHDHGWLLGREFDREIEKVTRLKHAKDVTPADEAAAGVLHPADPVAVEFRRTLRAITRRSRR